MRLAIIFIFVAQSALAGVSEAVNERILPGLTDFATSAADLSTAASESCEPDSLKPAFQKTFDAWMGIGDLRLGPSEAGALSIYFWPDKKGFTKKALFQLISAQDPAINDPERFSHVSIAARGLFALERMLYDPEFSAYETEDYACALVQTLTRDLASQAQALTSDWETDFAHLLLSPGGPDNIAFLDETEATRAIYTQILTSLENTSTVRLGRPLGETTRPRPQRAEAWRSERSLQNTLLATKAAVDLAIALADWDIPQTKAALKEVYAQAERISDPSFQDIDDLTARFAVEVLAQKIDAVHLAIEVEVGEKYGITPGFNSSDGD
ncbi:MAG: imelysin family protein [Maritimibacter sp.]